jgi:hypothetical protein
MRDGDSVYYTGRGRDGAEIGDEGRVLAVTGVAAHVKWVSGVRTGQVSLEDTEDLEPHRASYVRTELDDSLELGTITVHSARQVFDDSGAEGVLELMATEGHLAMLVPAAEQALEVVSHRVRHDPSLQAIASYLDEDELEAVVRLASIALIREAIDADA